MRFGLAFAATATLLTAGCSTEVAGNSAETGSPELAGVLYLDNGSPASLARVRVVGSSFDYYRGDDLSEVIEVVADSDGSYRVDSLPGVKSFSLEAFHEESGKRLLIQNLERSDSLEVNDSLENPGTALLSVENIFDSDVEGLKGNATVVGTTFKQDIVVKDSMVVVDSLPVGKEDVVLHLFSDKDTLETRFDSLSITSGDTTVFDTVPDLVVRTYAAPLKFPAGFTLDDTTHVLTDVPLAFRMDSSVMEFDSLTSATRGRFEAFRINAKGETFATLPIAISRLDSVTKEAIFWVRLDSLNVNDSILIQYNSRKSSAYAMDVFPTNGYFRTVWHFDDGIESFVDEAENSVVSDATPQNVEEVDGVVGKGFAFTGYSSITVDNAIEGELNFPADTMSFSVWVKVDEIGYSSIIFSKKNQYTLGVDPKKGFVVTIHETSVDSLGDTLHLANTYISGDSLLVASKWTHIYFQERGALQSLFIDGARIAEPKATTTDTVQREETSPLVIGSSFTGSIDELFFSDGYRSDDWAKVFYLNQSPDSDWPGFTVRQ